MSERRRDAATATVGFGAVAGGAVVREGALQQGHKLAGRQGKRVFIPSRTLYMAPKSKARGKARAVWAGGTALSAAGAPAAAVGTYGLARTKEPLHKRERQRSFVGEGVVGATSALKDKGDTFVHAPKESRGIPLAGGLAGGALGSLAAHRGLDKIKGGVPPRLRAATTATAGVVGGLGAMPAVSAAVRRRNPGYEMTPTGVKRAKKAPKRPSSASHRARGRRDIVPTDTFGKYENLSRNEKRARVYAAGALPIPIANDLAAAGAAARMAPKSQRRQAFGTTLGGIWGGSAAGAAAGGLAARALERRNPAQAQRAVEAKERVGRAVGEQTAKVPGVQRAQQARTSLVSRLPKPRIKGKITPAVALGGVLGQMGGGQAGGFAAYTRVLNNEDRLRSRGGVAKGRAWKPMSNAVAKAQAAGPVMNTRERVDLARTKRRSAALSVMTGVTGVGALGALAGSKAGFLKPVVRSKLKAAQTPLLTAGAGAGGINSFLGAKVQNREAKQVQGKIKKVSRGVLVPVRARPKSYVASGVYTRPGSTRPIRIRAGVR